MDFVAKFRNAPFFIVGSDFTGGRRTVTHEYPQSDDSFSEDLGRKVRVFTVDGKVLTRTSESEKNALIAALQEKGPGELVHPYYGRRQVIVTQFRVTESTKEIGIAYFSLEFEETPVKAVAPTAVVDTVAKLKATASKSVGTVVAEFVARYKPDFTHVNEVTTAIRSATNAVNVVVGAAQLTAQQVAEVKRNITNLEASVNTLIHTPEDLANQFYSLLSVFPSGGISKLFAIHDFAPGVRPVGTSQRTADAQNNFDQFHHLVQRLAIIQAAAVLPDVEFTSYEDAVSQRDELTELIDAQSETVSDDAYPTFTQLQADVVKAVPGEDNELPHIVSYTPPMSVPSLVLAHRLYGDVTNESDVLTRNDVENPFAVLGGRALEVLSDG